MKSNVHKKRTFEDKFARHFYCKHARLNYLCSDKKQCRRKERHYGKSLCKESEDTMAKIDWYYAAADKSFCMCPICEQKLDLV